MRYKRKNIGNTSHIVEISTGRIVMTADNRIWDATLDYELNRLNNPKNPLPVMCEECDCEMYRYEDSLDTNSGGFQCPSCGWSFDDDEDY